MRLTSVPQMPEGKNSTKNMNTPPTTAIQCLVNTVTTSSSVRNTPAPTKGPKKVPMPPSRHIITAWPDSR